jgi:hypothetical protein
MEEEIHTQGESATAYQRCDLCMQLFFPSIALL